MEHVEDGFSHLLNCLRVVKCTHDPMGLLVGLHIVKQRWNFVVVFTSHIEDGIPDLLVWHIIDSTQLYNVTQTY